MIEQRELFHKMSETSLSLDDHDLLLFISSFYGYGNMAARFWFIGMEEGVAIPSRKCKPDC